MSKLLRILFVAMVVGTVAVLFLSPLLTGLAAPAALPICGHSRIKPGATSYTGPPDIAKSANETYTAVVWAEGANGIGPVNLAYSNILTTTRIWNTTTVASGYNREPAIAFYPNGNTTVHIAYRQKEDGINNTGIRYIRCTLGGVCGSERTIATGTSSDNYTSPKIAVNAAGDPVIVYQKNTAASALIYHAYIENDGGGTIRGGFALTGTDKETNPTVAYVNDRVHVAYVVDNGPAPDNTTDKIKYTQLDVSGELSGKGGVALASSNNATFTPHTGMSEPEFPAIDAIGNTISLVWELKETVSKFHVVYNISQNNGVTWDLNVSGVEYRYYYLPSGNNYLAGPAATSDDRTSDAGSQFNGRLQPDVTLHMSGSITITHVAWHEETNSRRDVMYSFFDGSQWRGTPILSGVAAISYTNVTTVYGESAADPATENLGNSDNVRPRLVFNRPAGNRHRLQMVYMSQKPWGDQTMWYLRYNGWELGSNFINPLLSEKDSDCDNIFDEQEIPWPPGFTDSPPTHTVCNALPTVGDVVIDGNGDGDDDHFNCNSNADRVPDFLDTNADGDFQNDDVDSGWREYSTTGGVFLPIILKNS